MQLKFQRSQRAGGMLGGTVIFCLDARADYSPAEAANISKYKLGGQVVYSSQAARRHVANAHRQLDRVDSELLREKAAGIGGSLVSLAMAKLSLNVSISSLGRGHHIECKDLPELLDAEQALMEACRNVKQFLKAAATFNGSVILVDFEDDEKVHVSQGALTLDASPASAPRATTTAPLAIAPPSSRTSHQADNALLSWEGMNPADLAQFQPGDTESLFTALIGETLERFRASNPLRSGWVCRQSSEFSWP